ncbi:MAG TPA: hypothetical protein VKT24_04095 [Rhizomicrobium sp.]|nr:hypothetical protein [Rhizomicrobium sp.]
MPTLPDIAESTTAEDARRAFEDCGWRLIATGDWSWVFTDPSGAWAARLTPFDPAYRMFVDLCRIGPPNPFLPHIERVIPLARDGYVVVMQRLYDADEEAAQRFCRTLGIANDSGYAPSEGVPMADPHGDIAELRERLASLLADGARRFTLWGGSDIRPGNILADAAGQLKLIDPVYVRGKAIVEAIVSGEREALRDFTLSQLEDFLTIPVFKPGAETDALRRRVAQLFAK